MSDLKHHVQNQMYPGDWYRPKKNGGGFERCRLTDKGAVNVVVSVESGPTGVIHKCGGRLMRFTARRSG